MTDTTALFETPIALDRDVFMRRLISSLGYLNEGILGSDVAGAYVMNVGLSMGAAVEEEYKRHWGLDRSFTVDEYAHVIIDLKQKIQGNFSLVSKSDDKVVVQTTSCPFDEFVRQSPSLCFMTSSVFGGIAARNFGYAKTVLHRRIALGDPGCYVSVYLQRTPEAEAAIGREYFPNVDQASANIGEQLRLMNSVRQLRQELSETSSRWEEVVHGAADAICLLDREGRIYFANARWRDLLGVEADELVGAKSSQIIHPDEQAEVEAILDDVLRGLRRVGLGWQLRHRDGAWRDVLVSLGPVRDDQGRIVGALGIFRDVTEDREAQRLKDSFLSNASHELRTPVTTIKGLTELLLATLEKRGSIEPEQLAKRLRTIQREADRLALLGTELMDVARLQRGLLPMVRERHDLNEFVALCVNEERDRVTDSGVPTIVFQPATAPLPILAEGARLEQVIANLLTNAVKYSPNGSEILVTAEKVGSQAIVRVTDRGIGIPEREIPNLFSPFFRGSNASANDYEGLGLGLYLSKEIVDAHGGSISVTSVEGEGSTFTLSLPLDEVGGTKR